LASALLPLAKAEPAVTTHAEINARFVALNKCPQLMSETFDGWLAWPIVKERLWLACLQSVSGEQSARMSPVGSARRLLSGIVQIIAHLARPRPAEQALLYEHREVRLPDGRLVHPHLGRRPYDTCSTLHYTYGSGGGIAPAHGLTDYGVGAVLAAMACVLRSLPSVRATADRIAEAIGASCPELSRPAAFVMIADQLARFRLRACLFRLLYKRSGVRSVVVLDPDSKVAEVAAARSLTIPVVEVQHGMFSAQEPDYSWTAAHRDLPAPLPLPERVFVFGALWRDELLNAGYWRSHEVLQVENPVVSAYRVARESRPPRREDRPIRILFASQGYVRAAALSFWREVLAMAQHGGAPSFELRIKVHPLEEAFRGEYEELCQRAPDRCSLVPQATEAFEELLDADLMVSYTSLMMLEAAGMGVPVIGLRGGAAAEGFAVTFGLNPEAVRIPECSSAASFIELLVAWFRAEGSASGTKSSPGSGFDFGGLDIETALSKV
jgi:hypothetical protein